MFSNELEVIDRVVGNLEPIGAELLDIAGNPLDLTGKTILFRMIKISDGSVKVNNAAAVIDGTPSLGNVKYQPVTADMNTAGKYAMYFLIDDTPQKRFPYDGANWVLNIKAENK